MTNRTLLFAVCALVLTGVLARLVPHIPNATPLSAIAFASSLYLGRRWALIIPLAALALSDVIIGFYDWRIMASVYLSFALIAGISTVAARARAPFLAAALASSSILFFLITNAAVWLFSPWYEKSAAGLLLAYEMGLPFLRSMLLGDVVYLLVIVGAFELARYCISSRFIFSRSGSRVSLTS